MFNRQLTATVATVHIPSFGGAWGGQWSLMENTIRVQLTDAKDSTKKRGCLTSMLGSLFCKSSSIEHCCAKMIGKNSRLICEKGRLICRKVYVKACAKKRVFLPKKSRKTLVIPKIFSIFVVQKKSITDGKVSNKI